jgi:hypothetical protein
MWLYVPRPPASASAPASEGSTSDSMPPAEWSLWCTSSGKPMRRPSSWPGWKRRSYVRRLSGPTSTPSTLARWWASWISSLAERRARTSPWPGSAADSTASGAASSTSTSASPPSAPPLSSSGRTSEVQLELFPSSPSTSTPPATPPSSGAWCERVTWERPTSEPASSSWPTPTASRVGQRTDTRCSGDGRSTPNKLGWAVAEFSESARPTPRASDGAKGGPNQRGSKGDLMLPSAAVQWPTPSARDWKSGEHSEETARRNARPLNEEAWAFSRQRKTPERAGPESSPSAPSSPRLVLNPDFVDWMMGLEPGHTCACARGRIGSELPETESSPSRPPSPGESSGRRCSSG